MGGGTEISGREICAMLNAKADVLAPELLPNGCRDGRHWATSSVDDVKTGNYSLKLDLTGPKKGLWTDFGTTRGMAEHSGDILKLVALRKFGGAHKEAFHQAFIWARQFLGIEEADPAKLKEVRREVADRQRQAGEEAQREVEQKRGWAKGLWDHSVPIAGTPALRYLLDRGMDFTPLGKVPGSLRFHPAVSCPVRKSKHPAMVACIMGLDGQLRGVHRTYLDVAGGKGGPCKAVKVVTDKGGTRLAEPGEPKAKSHKLTIGLYAGGCIPLWKGSCGKTLRDIDAGLPVYCSEGIEDGLSVALHSPERRVVAAVAISNMGGLELPKQAGSLVLIGQNDPLNSKAVEAFEGAIARQQETGRTVQAMFPPAEFKDFNDLLMGKRL